MQPQFVEQGLMPSIVDRLIDPESAGTAILIGYDERKMLQAVRRDLEELLNTRQTYGNLGKNNTAVPYPEIETSILAYGLPDLASLEALTHKQREEIADYIRIIIQRYEPRMRDVRVVYEPGENSAQRSIRFRIEGKLHVNPSPDVAFDTVLELASGQYAVQES